VHHAPRDVAVIGLGSGDTAWAAGSRPETASIDVYEIAAPQTRLLRRLAEIDDPLRIRRFLADERVTIHVADGRNALKRNGKLYDVIEMDALPPGRAPAQSDPRRNVWRTRIRTRTLTPPFSAGS
jgi:spermidine synthase